MKIEVLSPIKHAGKRIECGSVEMTDEAARELIALGVARISKTAPKPELKSAPKPKAKGK